MTPELITLQLMKHVERSVRPVVADGQTKMRMRRELLGHLSAAYEEEIAVDGDPSAAVLRASQRLGTSEELTRRLQESIGRLETWRARNANWIHSRTQESMPRYVLLMAGFSLAVTVLTLPLTALLTLALWILVGWIVPDQPAIDREGMMLGFLYTAGSLFVVLPVAGATAAWLDKLLPRLVGGSLFLLGLAWFIAASLFVLALFTALLGWVTGRPLFILNNPQVLEVLVAPCLLPPAFFAAAMVGVEIGRRQEAQWSDLAIDAP